MSSNYIIVWLFVSPAEMMFAVQQENEAPLDDCCHSNNQNGTQSSSGILQMIQLLDCQSYQFQERLHQFEQKNENLQQQQQIDAKDVLRQKKLEKLLAKLYQRIHQKLHMLKQKTHLDGEDTNSSMENSHECGCSSPGHAHRCTTPSRMEAKLEKLQNKLKKLELKLDKTKDVCPKQRDFDLERVVVGLQEKVHSLEAQSCQFGQRLQQYAQQMAEEKEEQNEFKRHKIMKLEMKFVQRFQVKLRSIGRKTLGNLGNEQQQQQQGTIPEMFEFRTEYTFSIKPDKFTMKLDRLEFKLQKMGSKLEKIGPFPFTSLLTPSSFLIGQLEPTLSKTKDKIKHYCRICGDAATGIHYNVLSCNGCKTFFRRTILSGRKFVCKLGGNCQFNQNGRCSCRACRFRLCVEAGMNEHSIRRTPSANFILSIARRHFKHAPLEGPSSSSSAEGIASGREFNENPLEMIQHFLRLRQSSFPLDHKLSLSEVIERPSVLAQCNKYPLLQNPKDSEHADCEDAGVKGWLLLELFLGIEYLKTFEFFATMDQSEKVSLIKTVIIPNQVLTASYSQLNANSIQQQDSEERIQQNGKEAQQLPLEKKIRSCALEDLKALRPDQVQIALIRAILMLDEHCDKLGQSARQQIGHLRSKICTLLLTYLQKRHGSEGGVKHFGESLNFISLLYTKQQMFYNYFIYQTFILLNASPIPLFVDFMDSTMEIEAKLTVA